MIASRRDGRLVLVRQVDHQDQCGLMADVWGNEEFARPQPYAPLALAARRHDEGWRRWEEHPRIDADGAPRGFTAMDLDEHVALYRRGIEAAVAADARAGLLVSLHGQGLYERRRGLDPGPVTPRDERPPVLREYLDDQDAVQRAARASIGADPALPRWEWAAYRLLQAWDVLSLYLTWTPLVEGRTMTLPRVPRAIGDAEGVDLVLAPGAGPGRATCAPWPFAAPSVDLPVRARAIEDRRYLSDDDLRSALAAAPWTELGAVLSAGS
ncbi:MAG: DUF3891 family protein [Thermoleophilia bacterium]